MLLNQLEFNCNHQDCSEDMDKVTGLFQNFLAAFLDHTWMDISKHYEAVDAVGHDLRYTVLGPV